MIATIGKRIAVAGTVVALVSAGPAAALAETMNFKLLPRYSRATFKSDAPLETSIGTTADVALPRPSPWIPRSRRTRKVS